MAAAGEVKNIEKDKRLMDQYSRQIGEFGVAAMAKLVQMKILIIGLNGVGIEVAKNLILSGVGSVSLYHEEKVEMSDLGTNFYLKEEDVGMKSVAEASLPQLKSLNPMVTVEEFKGRFTNKDLKRFTFVVDCGLTFAQGLVCDEQCRRQKPNTKYIRARVHGLMGYIFNDFGETFPCVDKTGERPVTRIINKIEPDPEDPKAMIVRLVADKRHNIDFDGHVNFIKFEELAGSLGKKFNNLEPFEVKEVQRVKEDGKKAFDPFSLKVVLRDGMSFEGMMYEGPGQIVQVKKAIDIKYDSLKASLVNPIPEGEGMLPFTDGAKFGRPDQLHFALNGLRKYEEKHGKLPPANDEMAVEEVIALAKEYNTEMKEKNGFSVEEVDVDVVAKTARWAECQFQPLCTYFGGVVAQEVIKHTGKYTPLRQWLHMDCFEVLPEMCVDPENKDRIVVEDSERKPLDSRYDDMIKIFGKGFHDKLRESSTFLVGCGALGCELLKNFAMIGMACSEKGKITVTDNDTIEVSNLSRQFLFREENVGEAKSMAAGVAVKKMNKEINVTSMKNLVSPETENIFNEAFWMQQDFITNALDNVQARLYVDSQCVLYGKPLLESGTLGTKCNSQVVLPHLTASYADGPQDDAEEEIPMCTVRNFPTNIEHCIKWARARFTDIFEADSTKAAKFKANPEEYIKEMKKKLDDLSAASNEIPSLKNVIKIVKLSGADSTSFKTCVEEAWEEFHAVFRDKIIALIQSKPEDSKDEDGEKFWGKGKRFPKAADFDPKDDTHVHFVLAMANILSLTYGLVKSSSEFERDPKKVVEIVATLTPPEVKIEEVDLTEGDEGNGGKVVANELGEFEELLKELQELTKSDDFKNVNIEPASFEKDDDKNCHIDYITATSNLRAANYRIKPASAHECKMIAGKIIPAIATTTSAVCGLVCIELLKVIQPGKKLEAFKDSSNSLGVNYYQFMEPSPPVEEKPGYDFIALADVLCIPEKFTKWDKTIIRGEGTAMTVQQFLDKFNEMMKEKYDKDVKISYLIHPNANYQGLKGHSKSLFENEGENPLLETPLREAIAEVYGESVLGGTYVKLDCSVEDDDLQQYKIPDLLYVF